MQNVDHPRVVQFPNAPETIAEVLGLAAGQLREGRLYLSPFLCNTLWGFQSAEGVIRSLYPALRLSRQWGIPLEVA